VKRKETEGDREKRKIRQLAAPSSYPEQLASFAACFHGPTLHPPSCTTCSLLFTLLRSSPSTPDSSKHWPFVFSIVRFAWLLLAFVLFGPFSIFFFERVF
jgi:hypothetical protein